MVWWELFLFVNNRVMNRDRVCDTLIRFIAKWLLNMYIRVISYFDLYVDVSSIVILC